MRRNQKLTKVLVGRTIKTVTTEPGSVLVLFDDQSNIKVKVAGPATIPPGGKIKSVHEAKADFKIEFEDGSSATLSLANPGSSVAVRDQNNAVEYLG
jgi:hypothetical protein